MKSGGTSHCGKSNIEQCYKGDIVPLFFFCCPCSVDRERCSALSYHPPPPSTRLARTPTIVFRYMGRQVDEWTAGGGRVGVDLSGVMIERE